MRKNSLEEDFPETCRLLAIWGPWARDSRDYGLGYPSISPEQMAREGGGINTRGSGLKVIEQPPEIKNVESALSDLKQRHPKQFNAIRVYFSDPNTSIDIMSRIVGFTNRKVAAKYLGLGVSWIDSRLH